jgi:hypothetical protein
MTGRVRLRSGIGGLQGVLLRFPTLGYTPQSIDVTAQKAECAAISNRTSYPFV